MGLFDSLGPPIHTEPALSNYPTILPFMMAPVLFVLLLSLSFHQSFFFFFITEACDSSRMVPLCFSFCVSSFIVIHSVLSCLTFSTPPSSLLLLPLCSSVVVCSTQQTSAGRQCSVGMARRGQTPVIVAASFLILQQLVAGRQK